MRVEQNKELRAELLKDLAAEYMRSTYYDVVPHMMELEYCLTRSYDNRRNKVADTDKELMYFACGFGFERVLLAGCSRPDTAEKDGIYYSRDAARGGIGLELKTTRMYSKDGLPSKGWPESWLHQMMGYAYAEKHVTDDVEFYYDLAVLYMMQPELVVSRLYFDVEEVVTNWARLQTRKDVYLESLMRNRRPEPFKWNQEWECRNCKYLIRCQVEAGTAKDGKDD